MSHKYEDLIVWQKAKAFASDVYRVTEVFPKTEIYGLTSQLRRAAVSVASNIAEGQGRLTRGEFRHFLGQARGSLLELETQLAIAVDLHFLSEVEFKKSEERSSEVLRLLNGLIESHFDCATHQATRWRGRSRVSLQADRNSKPETRNLC